MATAFTDYSPRDPLDRILGPTRKRRQGAAVDLPDLSDEERESLLRSLASGTMSGLEYVGNVLDKVGAASRGLLAGEPEQLLHAVSFSGTIASALGKELPKRVTGRDLLERWGVLAPNTTGFDMGDVAGFAAEVATDPLSWVSGPINALTKSGKAAAKVAGTVDDAGRLAGKLMGLTPAAIAREIRDGERGLIQLGTPSIPFVLDSIPIGTPIGAGSKAAASLWEKLHYGKYAGIPARAIRTVFDSRVGDSVAGTLNPIVHASADAGYEAAQNWKAATQGLSLDLAKKAEDVKEMYETILANSPNQTPFDEALRAMTEEKSAISLADASKYFSNASSRWSPERVEEATNAFYGLADQMRNVDDAARADLKRLGFNVRELEDAYVRHTARYHGGFRKQAEHAEDRLFHSRFPFTINRLRALKNVPGGTNTVNQIASDPLFTAIRGNRGVFDVLVTPLMPQGAPIWKRVTGVNKKGQRYRPYALTDEARTVLRTELANRYNLVGKSQDELDEMIDYFGRMNPKILSQGTEPIAEFDNLVDAANFAKGDRMMSIVKNKKTDTFEVFRPGGLFNRGSLNDLIEYQMHAGRAKATMETLRNVLSNQEIVTPNTLGPSLADLWVKDMKLTPEGMYNMLLDKGHNVVDEAHAMQIAAGMNVPQDIADASKRMIKAASDPQVVNDIVKHLDKYNTLFRSWLTLPAIAYHTRNFLSGQWANWAHGIFDGKSINDAAKLIKGESLDDLPNLLDEVKTYEVAAFGRGGAQSRTGSNLGVGGRNVAMPDTSAFRHIFDPLFEAGGDVVRGRFKAAARKANPFGVEGTWDKLGGTETTNALFKSGENAADVVEWANRVGPYIYLRRQGWSPSAAARKVRMVQYDYREMTKFERTVMRRLIPFYGFWRKNLPAQIRELINNPGGRTAQTIRASNNLRERDEGYVPGWLAEGLPIRLGPDNVAHKLLSAVPPNEAEGVETFLSTSGLLPVEEAFNRFPMKGTMKGSVPDVHRMIEKLLAQTTSPLAAPMQLFTGRQFWSGRPINELHQYPTDNPELNFLLGMSPAARAVTQARTLQDDRKTALAKVINNLIGGTRVTQVDVPRAMHLEGRQILENLLSRSTKDVGKVTRYYPKVDSIDDLDPEMIRQLSLYQAVMEELRRINIRRERQKLQEAGKK